MDNKLLKLCLELYRAKPHPKWGKLRAELRVNGIKEVAGRKVHHYDNNGLGLLLEIEELKAQLPKKKVTKKKVKAKEE
jgi:hypothetical protein